METAAAPTKVSTKKPKIKQILKIVNTQLVEEKDLLQKFG